MTLPLDVTPEIAEAKAAGRAIVALESTIITHGMPYPQNLEMAQTVESDIRAEGAVPATLAVLEGRIKIGLDNTALEQLAQTPEPKKLSRADLSVALAQSQTGGTTVAATMILAHLAGIEVFATGGIGGVHRGAELSFDISADLQELARTPVCVVAAGAKAILDIPKTLEVLETFGVPVIGYQTTEFPAFWSRESGLPAPLTAQTPQDIAQSIRHRRALSLDGGHLIANPIPASAEIPHAQIMPVVEAVLAQAEAQGISGKDVTPFLLQAIFEATEGRSLDANIALVRNNARVAAQIARALV
ncbi:MAG: pseudouridine-5'-phosphate glycosidase [Pseudomonadota bacterium]